MSDYQPKKSPSQWISIQEAAHHAPYSQEYLSLLARRGKIFAKKIGRNWYTTHEALVRYISEQALLSPIVKINPTVELVAAPSTPNDLVEEFKRLNPQVFTSQETKSALPNVAPAPVIKSPFSTPSTPENIVSQKPSNIFPVNQRPAEKDILGKLDRLSDSLETFAYSVTQAMPAITQANQPAPLNPEVEEFIQEINSSQIHRFKHFNNFAKSTARSPVRLMTIMVVAIVLLFVLVGGFSFGQVDAVAQKIKKALTDATTIDGHFAGTHANEVLVLDKAGNISIYGHIETQGQLRSHAPDGVAPIVVDSMTKVENLNASYLDDLGSKDFTLAFITKNGNLTYEDVNLEGNVEVGQTLTVKGATKLLDSLQVYGTLGVFSDAVFGKNVTLTGGDLTIKKGNLTLTKGTLVINNSALIKNLNAEFLDGLTKSGINLQFVTSNGATTTSAITVGGLNVNGSTLLNGTLTTSGTSNFNGVGFFNSGVWGATGSFGSLGVTGDVSFGKKDNPENSRFVVFSKYFSVNDVGNTNISGSLTAGNTSTGNLLVRGAVLSNLIPSGSFDLGSLTQPWANIFTGNITVSGSANFAGTASSSFVINTDNVSSDSEDAYLAFNRGTITPKAKILWDSTNKLFNFNEPVLIASSSAMAFEVSGGAASISNTLFVQNNGNVGIGTTSPETKFEVVGTASISSTLTLSGIITSTNTASNTFSGSINSLLGIHATGNVTTLAQFFSTGTGSNSFAGSLDITKGLNVNSGTLRVTTGGNVGIGTTEPVTALDVQSFQTYLGTNTSARFAKSIVLANNQGLLSVNAAGTGLQNLIYSDTSNDTYIGAIGNTIFSVGGLGEKVRIDTNGNVGIGTTTPLTKLEVQGTASASNLLTVGGLQVAGGASVSYSRFGTGETNHPNYINATNDLLVSGDLEVIGTGSFDSSVVLGTTTTDSLIVNSDIKSDLIPFTNAFNLGSTTNHWGHIYVDTADITVLNAPTASISGTTANDFLINSDNLSDDAENMSVTFKRGSPVINAALQWDTTNKLFNFNFPILVQTVDLPEPVNNFTNLTLKGAFNQGTHNYFNINNYNGSPLLAVGASGWLAASGSFQAAGGSTATASYSRFGSAITNHGLLSPSDLLVSGKLEVKGNSYFSGTINLSGIASASKFYAQPGTAASPSFSFSTDQDTGMFRPASEQLGFSTFGVERLRIDQNGNVGIGSTLPTTTLDIVGSGATLRVANNNGGGGTIRIDGVSNGNPQLLIQQSATTRGFVFFDNATDLFVINRTGTPGSGININSADQVAIGTSTPTTALTVQSAGTVRSGLSSHIEIQDTNTDAVSAVATLLFSTKTGANFNQRAAVVGGTQTVADSGGYLAIYTRPDGSGSLAERLRVDKTGNVAIGTTIANQLLTLKGTAGATDLLSIASSSGNSILYVAKSGNVGIGTTVPITKLNVSGGTGDATTYDPQFALSRFSSTGNNEVFKFRLVENVSSPTNYGDLSILRKSTPSALEDDAYYTSALYIDGRYGYVGIGTTAPLTTLHVVDAHGPAGGTTPQGGLVVANVGVTNGLLDIGIDSSGTFYSWLQSRSAVAATYYNLVLNPVGGNVGIGDTSPEQKLTVTGNILASSSANVDLILRSSTATADDGKFTIRSTGASDRLEIMGGTTPTSLMTIASTGYVGIGTTAPGEILDVRGNGKTIQVYDTAGAKTTGMRMYADTGVQILAFGSQKNFTIGASDLSQSLSAGGFTSYVTIASASGNVGIGNSTPASRLEISSLMDTDQLRMSYIGDRNYSNSIYNHFDGASAATNQMYFKVANGSGTQAEVMRLVGNGNVGIGTTSPTYKLEISAGTSQTYFHGGDATTRYQPRLGSDKTISGMTEIGDLLFVSNSDPSITQTAIEWFADGVGAGRDSKMSFKIRDDGTERALILDGSVSGGQLTWPGNVGIGTTVPDSKLTLANSSGAWGTETPLHFTNGDATQGTGSLIYKMNTSAGVGGGFAFAIKNNSATTPVWSDSVMTILNTGNVGIGTTDPATKLHVKGTTSALTTQLTNAVGNKFIDFTYDDSENTYGNFQIQASALTLQSNYGGSVNLALNPLGGNVGIGTTVPATKLDIRGIAGDTTSLLNLGTGNSSGSDIVLGAAANKYGLIVEPTVTLTGAASNFASAYVWGHVTAATAQTLTTAIGLRIDALSKSGSATITNAYGLYVNTPSAGSTNVAAYIEGNVGIGTTVPAALLSVGSTSQFQVSSAGAVTANLGATAAYPLILTSSSVTTSLGSLNGIYFHNNTTATSGFYYYQSITTAGSFIGPGTGLTGTASSLSIGGNAGTVTNGVYTTSAIRWPKDVWMYASGGGAGVRNWYIGTNDMYWELGGAGSFHFRNSADADVATIGYTGIISGLSFTGAGTGLTGTAASLNIGGTAGSETLATVTGRGGTTSSTVHFYGASYFGASDQAYVTPAEGYVYAPYFYSSGAVGYLAAINGSFTTNRSTRSDGSYRILSGSIYDDGVGYIETLGEIYPGRPDNRGVNQGSYYIAGGYAGYGMYVNTSLDASGGLWDAGTRVCAGSCPANGGTATYATYLWSTGYVGTYYLSSAWDGSYWQLTSNHGSAVNVGHATNATTAVNISAYTVNQSVGTGNSPQFASLGVSIAAGTHSLLDVGTTSTSGRTAWFEHGTQTSGQVMVAINTSDTSAADEYFLQMLTSNAGRNEFLFGTDGYGHARLGWVTPADVAEWTRVIGEPSSYQPGELVSFSGQDRKATKASMDSPILSGVITVKPGLVGLSYDIATDAIDGSTGGDYHFLENKYNAKMVATVGYTPIKVSTEGGPLKSGDGITISSIDGVGRKAKPGEKIVGYAYETFDPANGKMGTNNVDVPTQIDNEPFHPMTTQVTLPDNSSVYQGWVFGYVLLGIEPFTLDQLAGGTASGSIPVTISSGTNPVDVLAALANAVLAKVQNLWASGDIIAEGIKKTYFATANTLGVLASDIASLAANWGTRDITIANTASDATKALFTGNSAQAADQSKVDLVASGSYLATYGVDSTKGEIQLSGSSQITNGEAKVYFDYSFSSIISDKAPIRVMVTPTSIMQGQLYTEAKTQFGFVVKELNAVESGTFDWLVIARRKGFDGDVASSSPSIVVTPAPTPTPTLTPDITPTPTPESMPTPTPVPTETPAPTPDVTPTPIPEVTPIATPEITPTPIPTETPASTPEPTPIPDTIPTPTP